jgi:hypothetical protein
LIHEALSASKSIFHATRRKVKGGSQPIYEFVSLREKRQLYMASGPEGTSVGVGGVEESRVKDWCGGGSSNNAIWDCEAQDATGDYEARTV